MAKSITVNVKRPGRPATGQDPVSAVRLPANLTKQIDRWATKHELATRSDAIRRLVELGLRKAAPNETVAKSGSATKAKQLAAKTIDHLGDPAASTDEQASRKRHLLKGPEEFREVRVDQNE